MIIKTINYKNKNYIIQEFNITEFYKFITKQTENNVFKNTILSSIEGSYEFTKTISLNEALDLFIHGDKELTQQLTNKLQNNININKNTVKQNYDIIGYQISVPRYLQGIPTNMINNKIIQKQTKIITLYKSISYPGVFTANKIIENSLKALQIVQQLEIQGYRINLNILVGTQTDKQNVIAIVRIKSANERMAISKMAFCLAHPSMLRRLYFRYIETSPIIIDEGFRTGYGKVIDEIILNNILKLYNKTTKTIYLPKTIENIEDFIKNL
jgi:hypothetical protein